MKNNDTDFCRFKGTVPVSIAKNFIINGDFSTIDKWKAKVLVCNSGTMKIGEWDDVGYVMISLTSNLIIPIARCDEHQTGYDLLYDYYFKKNLIPNEEFVSIWVRGGNYVFPKSKKDFVIALKKAREYGMPDNTVNGINESRDYSSTTDNFINTNGDMTPIKKDINPIGKKIIQNLENIANMLNRKDKAIFPLAYSFYEWMFKNSVFYHLGLEENTLDNLLKAEANEDFDAVANIFFSFNGLKNILHNNIRKANATQKDKDFKYTYNNEKTIGLWGNIPLAMREFDRLGQI